MATPDSPPVAARLTGYKPLRQVRIEQDRELLRERRFIDFVSSDLEALEEGLVELPTRLRIGDGVCPLAVSGQIQRLIEGLAQPVSIFISELQVVFGLGKLAA